VEVTHPIEQIPQVVLSHPDHVLEFLHHNILVFIKDDLIEDFFLGNGVGGDI